MSKTELGTKRTCPETGRKFYDLGKDPIVSPYTGQTYPVSFFEVVQEKAPVKAKAEKPVEAKAEKKEAVVEDEDENENDDIEVVSLEDAEDVVEPKKAKTGSANGDDDDDDDDDDNVDDIVLPDDDIDDSLSDDDDDDDTFLADDDEDDDEDVSVIIGVGDKGNEET